MSEAEFAKTHLREHLMSLIIPSISKGFWSIYDTSKELCERNQQPDQMLRTFQNMLTKIPEWSETTLTTEVERIATTTKCAYLEDLLMGVFIAYMKSFASLHYRGNSSHVSVDFEPPTMTKFVHELYIQSARKLWQVAYLFKTQGVSSEQQARNRQEIERYLNEAFELVVRSFLPWQSIAKQFTAPPAGDAPPPAVAPARKVVFDEEDDEEEDDDDEEEDAAPPNKSIQISEEEASIDVDTFSDAESEDPLKELDAKATDTFVLNL